MRTILVEFTYPQSGRRVSEVVTATDEQMAEVQEEVQKVLGLS